MFESGKGATLTDVEGYEYLDALAGIILAHLDLGRKEIAQVAYGQMSRGFLESAEHDQQQRHQSLRVEFPDSLCRRFRRR